MANEERRVSPEEEARKEVWLKDLAEFVVEANNETWAADKGEIPSAWPNHKTRYYKRGDWELIDDYSAYFKAPGITWVHFKSMPVWHMFYGGKGMEEKHYGKVKQTFNFLRDALKKVTTVMPFRGPSEYKDPNGTLVYKFRLLRGNIEDCDWEEEVDEEVELLFSQKGQAGIVIHKDKDRKPILPWNL